MDKVVEVVHSKAGRLSRKEITENSNLDQLLLSSFVSEKDLDNHIELFKSKEDGKFLIKIGNDFVSYKNLLNKKMIKILMREIHDLMGKKNFNVLTVTASSKVLLINTYDTDNQCLYKLQLKEDGDLTYESKVLLSLVIEKVLNDNQCSMEYNTEKKRFDIKCGNLFVMLDNSVAKFVTVTHDEKEGYRSLSDYIIGGEENEREYDNGKNGKSM